ncbi:MAG: extracellular solute-binding protein [Oscillospiraceae bacterium]|jgi:ABC-type glycerol-3-phosphate transport system substrate-binding protein|nr:extracellular solute-binding protein [Oscillospiraceae bacterium]
MYIAPEKKKFLYMGVAAAVLVVAVIFALTRGGVGSYYHKYAGFDLTPPPSMRGNTYLAFLDSHAETAHPRESVKIDITSFNEETSVGATIVENYEGTETALETTDASIVEFTVDVPEAGLYTLHWDYFPVKSRGIDIERAVKINGVSPFLGAERIIFYRIWGDEPGGIRVDNQNNQIRPSQIEHPRWESAFFMDSQGYVVEPYRFYFEKGENTITLTAINEPVAFRNFELSPVRDIPYYEEYIAGYDLSHFPGGNMSGYIKVQGEDATHRSSPSLYAFFDTSSATTEPYSVTTIVLNAIGGERWRVPGQWIEWEIDVPENGMYRFSFKGRQSYNRGMVSNRALYVNGEIPCREAMAVPFFFNNNWQLVTPQDVDGNDMFFPLEKGINTIRLQVTLGDLSSVLAQLEESIIRLNSIYRQILVLTGAEPDPYRDYRLHEVYPDMMDEIAFESRYLYKLMDDIIAYTGQMGPEIASLSTVARQLELFVRKPHDIPRGVQVFKDNIAAVGTSLVSLNSSPLDIDWITITDEKTSPPVVRETFLQALVHEVNSFFATFFIDYNNVGNVYDSREVTEVWIFSGRDQATVLKSMIDDTYTPDTGNFVNLKLVDPLALMPAVVAGTGPDVAVTVNNNEPINYAFRNASMDLTKFTGFNEVASEFHESAFVPFQYLGGIYGMPQTQIFSVMYYRTDILAELGLMPPQTWDEVIAAFPILQHRNMSIGIPSVERKIGQMTIPDLSNFFSQLLQRGGSLYNDEGSRSRFDSEQSVAAFEAYTKFFTHYKAPLHYEFANRFRSGEMPLGFADYDTFNMLQVFAPEIRGLWQFDLLPGTLKPETPCRQRECCADESCHVITADMEVCCCKIDRSTASWGQASMILSKAKDPLKAWEFLRWWANSDTQLRFGRELEAIMGTAARYQTANQVAFRQLGWNARDSAVLEAQWEWVIGIPEVPGGYYVGRHIVNAVRRVINDSVDIRETLLDYTRSINDELTRKRREFGLSTY